MQLAAVEGAIIDAGTSPRELLEEFSMVMLILRYF
jgi:hypothetical protein